MNTLPTHVVIQDVILREGQQAAEIAFTMDEKVELSRRIAGAGVRRLQAGYAGSDDDTIAAIKRAVPELELSALLIAFRDDWSSAAEGACAGGVDLLMVLFRIAPGQLAAMGFSEEQALDRIATAVQRAAQLVPVVSFDPSFVTIAEQSFLQRAYETARDAGAHRYGLADSTGVASPERVSELVTLIRAVTCDGEVGVHCHDDFGLGLANTIAGLASGATLADASVLGLGERAGNCALEELAVALKMLYGVETGVHLERLTALAEYVSDISGWQISPAKSIVGHDAFSQKLDMHVALTRKDPALLEPFAPALVGNQRRLRLGVGTGPLAVEAKLAELSLPPLDGTQHRALAAWINDVARDRKTGVTDAEFRDRVHATEPPAR
ncbi:MAG: LeuA family protein [Candidatus Dormibacteria bacterium]